MSSPFNSSRDASLRFPSREPFFRFSRTHCHSRESNWHALSCAPNLLCQLFSALLLLHLHFHFLFFFSTVGRSANPPSSPRRPKQKKVSFPWVAPPLPLSFAPLESILCFSHFSFKQTSLPPFRPVQLPCLDLTLFRSWPCPCL